MLYWTENRRNIIRHKQTFQLFMFYMPCGLGRQGQATLLNANGASKGLISQIWRMLSQKPYEK